LFFCCHTGYNPEQLLLVRVDGSKELMGKVGNFLIGAVLGAAVGVVINYVFGPATGSEYNQNYRSRLDKALEEGDHAAQEHEAEMRRQFEAAKRGSGGVGGGE
jgi:hypothetical protein